MSERKAIGVFDSGYGGLTVLSELQRILPQYDYLYLGDNARAPYGSHSFELIYKYTRQGVNYLFSQGCPLVILACNTASARALRQIQMCDLPNSSDPTRRVLGVIRPTVEYLGQQSANGHMEVGLVATEATVASNSYQIETEKYAPNVHLVQKATPLWAALVERGEIGDNPGVNYFVQRDLAALQQMSPDMQALVLACTHYPMLLPRIHQALPEHIQVIPQGAIVAHSLQDYLQRHPEMDRRLSKNGATTYCTTENDQRFATMADYFMPNHVNSEVVNHVSLSDY
ncbi:glutamate racemase [Porphyromonas levii]|uniref:glutamate racemase n=1 Tax=Porphyromonas levii TaxID=28114 RepID=UPI00037F4C97|nr:glutamate racemase [Porphyromonas levii]MBR8703095.1 Glutamate racemase [Porphyromonas levii]MBR8713710.1 Glutamate racemase [Porphyromonas levii]MBR8715724.1 Glutamate racemase [Porphyromonas levii]MBR8728271.1 Glutamate racemase [Porphyromonas levii]MBR8729585.1 Glutamate racemase [Porphyromonas levii]